MSGKQDETTLAARIDLEDRLDRNGVGTSERVSVAPVACFCALVLFASR